MKKSCVIYYSKTNKTGAEEKTKTP